MVMKLTPEERLWRQQLPQELVNLLPLEGQDHGLSGAEEGGLAQGLAGFSGHVDDEGDGEAEDNQVSML